VENNIFYFVEKCEKIYDDILIFSLGVIPWLLGFMCIRTTPTKMEQKGCYEREVQNNSDARESPKRKKKTFRTRRNFTINNIWSRFKSWKKLIRLLSR